MGLGGIGVLEMGFLWGWGREMKREEELGLGRIETKEDVVCCCGCSSSSSEEA